ncbi:hypothetical protein ABIE67_009133 [Streptomyces sp. V4I8]|uniref:hypothetical protein n=1 Tax=Streptomyces sp. V4I8 TaxID=3156469 RepID=UPI0035195B66
MAAISGPGLRAGSSRPRHRPHATRADVVSKIVSLRQNCHFGPVKSRRTSTERCHDIEIACSAVCHILKKLGMNRLPASLRYQRHDKRSTRYGKQLPGNRVQVDVKFIEPVGVPTVTSAAVPVTGKLPKARRRANYYQFTAIDYCTRLRVLRIHPRCDQKTAIQFLYFFWTPAVARRGDPGRQRRGVPMRLPLARAGQGHRPHLHQTGVRTPQRQDRLRADAHLGPQAHHERAAQRAGPPAAKLMPSSRYPHDHGDGARADREGGQRLGLLRRVSSM